MEEEGPVTTVGAEKLSEFKEPYKALVHTKNQCENLF
jgi:hypothetical protein